MDQNRSERLLLRAAAILFGLSALLVAVAFTQFERIISKILMTVCAAIPFLIGLFLVYLVILSRRASKQRFNYFLYDRKLRGNMPAEQLTASHVSDCLMRYMTLFRQGKRLYINQLFEESSGVPNAFKPLFCYQILGMMSASTQQSQWDAFLEGGKEMADVFSTYLAQAGEDELSRDIQFYMATSDAEASDAFRQYLQSRQEYLSERMLAYTKEHIREFD